MNTRKKTPLRYSHRAAPAPIDSSPKPKPKPAKKRAPAKKAAPSKAPKPTRQPSSSIRHVPLNPNDWEENYKALKQHKSKYGTCKITKDDMATYNVNLARWCTWQRIDRDTLKPDQKARLNAIDFLWDVPIPDHFRFECMYTKLKRYHAQYGDCLVPVRWKQDPKFGKWVSRQRETHETLPKDRKAKLDALGFTWKVRAHEKKKLKEEQRHEPVSRKYTETAAYKRLKSWQDELAKVVSEINAQSSTKLPAQFRDWLSEQLWSDSLTEEQTRQLVEVLGSLSPNNQTATCLWDHRLLHVSALLQAYGMGQLDDSKTEWLEQQVDLLRHGGLPGHQRQILLACLKHNGLRHTVNGIVETSQPKKKKKKSNSALAPKKTASSVIASSSLVAGTDKSVSNKNNKPPTTQTSTDPPTEPIPSTDLPKTAPVETLGSNTPKTSNRKPPVEGTLSFGPPKLTCIPGGKKGLKIAKESSATMVTPEATPRNKPAVGSYSSSTKTTKKTKRPRPYSDEEARSFVAACSRKLKQLHRPTKRKRMLTF